MEEAPADLKNEQRTKESYKFPNSYTNKIVKIFKNSQPLNKLLSCKIKEGVEGKWITRILYYLDCLLSLPSNFIIFIIFIFIFFFSPSFCLQSWLLLLLLNSASKCKESSKGKRVIKLGRETMSQKIFQTKITPMSKEDTKMITVI